MAGKTAIVVEIRNWEKFNPRKDVGQSSWFRMEHSYFEDRCLFRLSPAQREVWLFLLCTASKNSSSVLELDFDYIKHFGRFTDEDIDIALEALQKDGRIAYQRDERPCDEHVTPTLRARDEHVTPTLRARDEHVTHACATDETDGRDGRDETNISCAAESAQDRPTDSGFDFDSVYENYPKRQGDQGKKKGIASCKRNIRTPERFEQFKLAVQNYRTAMERCGSAGTIYVKRFQTFANDWDEWIKPPEVSLNGKKPDIVEHNQAVLEQVIAEFTSEASAGRGGIFDA